MWSLCDVYPFTPPRVLKPEAEMDEDGVVVCSGPEEGEEVGQVKPPLGWEWNRAESGHAKTAQRPALHYSLLLPQG